MIVYRKEATTISSSTLIPAKCLSSENWTTTARTDTPSRSWPSTEASPDRCPAPRRWSSTFSTKTTKRRSSRPRRNGRTSRKTQNRELGSSLSLPRTPMQHQVTLGWKIKWIFLVNLYLQFLETLIPHSENGWKSICPLKLLSNMVFTWEANNKSIQLSFYRPNWYCRKVQFFSFIHSFIQTIGSLIFGHISWRGHWLWINWTWKRRTFWLNGFWQFINGVFQPTTLK